MAAEPTDNPTTPVVPAAPEASKSMLEKVGVALPIALTAIATIFAGLSTGELQKAMFWRSYAAQDQSKATNQWSYAGFKRDRALICQTSAMQLRAVGDYAANPFAGASESAPAAQKWLAGQGPPAVKAPPVTDETVKKLLDDIRTRVPEKELVKQAGKVKQDTINGLIDEAEQFADSTSASWDDTLKEAQKLTTQAKDRTAAQAAMLDLDNRRYRAESTMNQGVGYLYDARVRVSVAESEKHQRKSYNFFYAMLAGQIGATISSLALARKQKSLLWAVAGLTGVTAVLIGGSVFLAEL